MCLIISLVDLRIGIYVNVYFSVSLTGMMVKENTLYCSAIGLGSGDYLAFYFVPLY